MDFDSHCSWACTLSFIHSLEMRWKCVNILWIVANCWAANKIYYGGRQTKNTRQKRHGTENDLFVSPFSLVAQSNVLRRWTTTWATPQKFYWKFPLKFSHNSRFCIFGSRSKACGKFACILNFGCCLRKGRCSFLRFCCMCVCQKQLYKNRTPRETQH